MNVTLRKLLCFTLALLLASTPLTRAQQTTLVAPVPSQIQQAQTIFLTNSGSDPNFPIDATKAYNDIYAALETWAAINSSTHQSRPTSSSSFETSLPLLTSPAITAASTP